jgi:YgiT-type zinc finger domain-containing protein
MKEKCAVCGSTEFRHTHITEHYEIDGKNIIVENIPARVCNRCGDVVISAETTENLRAMLHENPKPARVETVRVFEYLESSHV